MSAARPDPVANGCLASYLADPRRYDELLDTSGTIRPQWRPLIDRLTDNDARAVARRGL